MIIKIEIDVKPEELRRFLGLPDVAALQEDMVDYLRYKVGTGIEGFDPAQFLRENIETGSKAWKKLMSLTNTLTHEEEGTTPAKRSSSRKTSRKSSGSSRRSSAKPTSKKSG